MYLAATDENPASAQIVVPNLTNLMTLSGARDLTFQRLAFFVTGNLVIPQTRLNDQTGQFNVPADISCLDCTEQLGESFAAERQELERESVVAAIALYRSNAPGITTLSFVLQQIVVSLTWSRRYEARKAPPPWRPRSLSPWAGIHRTCAPAGARPATLQ